jgi:hypothetical protein
MQAMREAIFRGLRDTPRLNKTNYGTIDYVIKVTSARDVSKLVTIAIIVYGVRLPDTME